MTIEEVLNYYKTGAAVGRAVGLGRTAIYNWRMRGKIPLLSQFIIERDTNGVLKADQPTIKRK